VRRAERHNPGIDGSDFRAVVRYLKEQLERTPPAKQIKSKNVVPLSDDGEDDDDDDDED
jgi:hypothetical protein